MTSIISGLLIASLLLIQGIGGKAGIGGTASVGGSIPVPPPAYATNCSDATNTVITLTCGVTGVQAGDFIAVAFLWYATDSPSSVLDNGSAIMTPALTSHPVVWDASARSVDLYCEANASSGTHNIQINFASGNRLIAMGIETFHGASTAACTQGGGGSLDGTPVGYNITSTTNPQLCNAITTTQGNDTIFSSLGLPLNTVAAGTGFTGRNTFNTNYITEDGPAVLAGSIQAAYSSIAAGKQSYCLAMAIKHV